MHIKQLSGEEEKEKTKKKMEKREAVFVCFFISCFYFYY